VKILCPADVPLFFGDFTLINKSKIISPPGDIFVRTHTHHNASRREQTRHQPLNKSLTLIPFPLRGLLPSHETCLPFRRS
jgi:hypothetical protein